MDPWQAATATLAALIVILAAILRALLRRLRAAAHARRSQATRHGQTMEHFAPFLADWPWDPKRFRFLGSPVDGIQFTDDEVLLVEIKTGRSSLSPGQRHIRRLVEAGRVRWVEVRL